MAEPRRDGHPPKPPLALALGVIGHRPNRLAPDAAERIAADIDAVLTAVAAEMVAARSRHGAVFGAGTVLSLVTSLAEGADRFAARAVAARLSAGEVAFALDVVLPFAAETFADDFAEDASRADFRELLGGARAVLELPGARGADASAYEAAAYTVLEQSDIVLAVWDGGPSAGRGGTTETLDAAARDGMPIIIVDAEGKTPPEVRWPGFDAGWAPTGRLSDMPTKPVAEGLPLLVNALVRPPAGAAEGADGRLHHGDERQGLTRFLREAAPSTNPFLAFPMMMAVLGVRAMRVTDLHPTAPSDLAAEVANHAPQPADTINHAGGRPETIAGAYGWADFIGGQTAQKFRGAFILNFVFAAAAVVCAAISIVQHDWKPWLVCIELLLIVTVVLNTSLGWRSQWHRRWFEGRELAERLRVALLLWMLGLRPDAAHDAEPTWTGWYARAIVRAQGLRHARLDADGVAAARLAAAGLIDDQCSYHSAAGKRMHLLEHRLELVGLACLLLTILVAAGYLVLVYFGLTGGHGDTGEHVTHAAPTGGGWDIGLTVAALTAGLPALATATYGIRVIGDFVGISRRSERTHHGLSVIAAGLKSGAPNLRTTRARVRAAADVMLGDVAGWRLSAESRGLAIPG